MDERERDWSLPQGPYTAWWENKREEYPFVWWEFQDMPDFDGAELVVGAMRKDGLRAVVMRIG